MSEASVIAHQMDRLMRRIEAGLHGRAVAVDADRVGPLGGMVLLALEEIEPAPIQQLVTSMGRDKSQMTRIIQMLEMKGHLQRRQSPDDGRVSLLRLSKKGHAFVGEIKNILSDVVGDLLTPLDPSERKALADILKRL
ncbi:MarR family winged helix-turn-helix transcriptional regulator [Hoeflea sp.]|uniref:MarR family winged helix-turn-helix transcriptional regulator n=1 Tax=Hoeflea sp. TaxID=1940281 RepID=UPI003B01A4C9